MRNKSLQTNQVPRAPSRSDQRRGTGPCTGLQSVPPNLTSTQNLRMGPYLETEVLSADGIKRQSYWIRVGPKSNNRGLYGRKEREIQTQTHEERGCVPVAAETSRAATSQGTPAPPEVIRAREGSSPRVFRESVAPMTRISGSGLRSWASVNFCCFKPSSLQSAALMNEYCQDSTSACSLVF